MTEAGWTREKPTVAGWYWWRFDASTSATIVRIMVCGDGSLAEMSNNGHLLLAANFGGLWLGPISPTDRQQGKVEGIQESKNLVSEFIEAWLLAGMVAKLLTPAVHEAVGGLSRDLRRELQKIEQAAQDEKGGGDGTK